MIEADFKSMSTWLLKTMLHLQPSEKKEKLSLVAFSVANPCLPMQKQTPPRSIKVMLPKMLKVCTILTLDVNIVHKPSSLGLKPRFIHLHDIQQLLTQTLTVEMIWVNAWLTANHLWNNWEGRIHQSQLLTKGRIHTCSVGIEPNRLCSWTELSHYLKN